MTNNLTMRRQVQKICTKFHLLFMLPIIGYLFVRWIIEQDIWYFFCMLGILSIMLVENIMFLFRDTPLRLLGIMRYIEFCLGVILMIIEQRSGNALIAFSIMGTFNVEYFLSTDFANKSNRKLYIISVLIPMEVACVIGYYFRHDSIEYYIINIISCFVYVFFCAFLTKIFVEGYQQYIKKSQEQQQLLEEMKKNKDLMKQHQTDIENANEILLLRQKELEVANEEIKNTNAMLQLQNKIVHQISYPFQLDELLRVITNLILEEMDVDLCAISIIPEIAGNKQLSYNVSSRYGKHFDENMSQALLKNELNAFLQEEGYYVDNFIQNDEYIWLEEAMLGSLLVLPIMREENVVGYFCVGHPKHEFFKEYRIDFFRSIATELEIALKNINLYEEMRYHAVHDSLTGLYNRGKFMHLYTQEVNDAMTSQRSLAVVLFDIDYFKQVNDTYGHIVGDQVICSIAVTGKEIVEDFGGIIGRYGGDKFIIAFPNCTEEEVCHRVKKLHEKVRLLTFVENRLEIRISSGITVFPSTCSNPNEILKDADCALFYSKQNGRDKMTLDSPIVRNAVALQ